MLRTMRTLVVASALLYVGCVGREIERVRPIIRPAEPSLRVMTYNLFKDSTRREAALDVIAAHDPDVIFFQEASDEWQALLRWRLAARYPYAAFNRPVNGYDGIGMMSKVPILENRWLAPTGGGWFEHQRVLLETPVGRVQVLNVHLRPPVSDGGSNLVGYFSTGGVRKREMSDLRAQLTPRVATLVVGDFNEGDDGGAVKELRAAGFGDALREFDRSTPTWRGTWNGMTFTERPDRVTYSGGLKCFEARVIAEEASDHDAVLAVIGRR